MRNSLVLLLVLLGFCTFPSHARQGGDERPAYKVDLGIQETPWGRLQVYDGLRAIHMEQPKYPKEANKSRAQGEVIVVVLIGENGLVLDAKVQQGSGSSALDQAAVSGIKKWKYPVRKNQGRCVTSQPFAFSIAD